MKRILSRIPNCENSQVTKASSNFQVSDTSVKGILLLMRRVMKYFAWKKYFGNFFSISTSVALRWVSAARVSAFIRAGRNKYFSGMGATFGKNVSTILVTKQPILHESATYIRVALLGFALKLSLKFGCNVVIVFRCASSF